LPLPRCNRMVSTICGYDVHRSLAVRVCFRNCRTSCSLRERAS
jgi:hypothetical protein